MYRAPRNKLELALPRTLSLRDATENGIGIEISMGQENNNNNSSSPSRWNYEKTLGFRIRDLGTLERR